MRFSSSARGALLLAIAMLVGCGAAAEGEDDTTTSADVSKKAQAPQMNDVSVLLPLAKTQSEFDGGYLLASSKGLGGALLPETLYTKATGAPATPPTKVPIGASPMLAYSALRMIAFRIDPCFANIGPVTDDASCKNQLRLVFQGVTFSGGSGDAGDSAVHAFYSLTRDDLVTLVKAVAALRVTNGGTKNLGALAVHPIIEKQGLLGDEAKGLYALVLKYAGTKNLTRFTTIQSENLATEWAFSGFDVASGKTTQMVIPTLPDKGTSVTFFAGFGADLAGGFTPSTTAGAADDMQLLGNLANAQAATKAAQQAALDAAIRIENPNDSSPNTIDCASCHLAGPTSILTAGKLGLSPAGNKNAFVADSRFVSATNMKQSTPVNLDNGLNVHTFSYRNTEPMVSMRVINETASIVSYLNGTVLSSE